MKSQENTFKSKSRVGYCCGRKEEASLFSTGVEIRQKIVRPLQKEDVPEEEKYAIVEKQKPLHLSCFLGADGEMGTKFHHDVSFVESLSYAIYLFVLQFIEVRSRIVLEKINLSLLLLSIYAFVIPLIPMPILISGGLVALGGCWKLLLLHQRYLIQTAVIALYIHFRSDLGAYFTASGAPLDAFSLAFAYGSIYLRIFFFLRGSAVVSTLNMSDEHQFRKVVGRLLLTCGNVAPDIFMISCMLFGVIFYYVAAPSYYALENVVVGMGVASSLWTLNRVKHLPVGFKVNFILF